MKNILGRPIKGKMTMKKTPKNRDLIMVEQDIIAGLANNFLTYLKEQNQDPQKKEPFQEELESIIEHEFGFTEEAKAKTKAMFYKAVGKTSQFHQGLAKLVGQYSSLVEDSDVVDRLCDRIQQLEDAIAHYERENLELASTTVGKLSESYNLDEATVEALWNNSSDFDDLERKLKQATKPDRPAKRSFIGEQLEELNEDPSWANGEEYVSAQMAQYLKYLK
jgi:hypothetical protein